MAAPSNRTKMGGNFVFEVSNSASTITYLFILETVQILRKQARWVGGRPNAYVFLQGGWVDT